MIKIIVIVLVILAFVYNQHYIEVKRKERETGANIGDEYVKGGIFYPISNFIKKHTSGK